ncbi:MAG: hypothetical protein ACYTGW_04920 [Planctomycetota bacterium]|jgi:hypothetical protein
MAVTVTTVYLPGIVGALLAIAPLAAQAAISPAVSPTYYVNTEAPNANGYPFSRKQFRQQQAHRDLRGRFLMITKMSFRRDQKYGGTQFTSTLEVFLGDADINKMTTTFSANYLGTPVQTVSRKAFSLPDHPGLATQTPAPFDVVLPFDKQYLYVGRNDLLWEIRIHGNSLNKDTTYFLDSHGGGNLTALGAQRVSGAGCVAPGGRRLTLTVLAETDDIRFTGQWDVHSAPLNAGCILLVGLQNPDQRLPGWCTKIYSDGLVPILGKADGFGRFSTGRISVAHNNQGFGTVFHSQAWVGDSSIKPLGIHGSNGVASTLAFKARLRRLFKDGSPTAATGTLNKINDFVLVTKFN